MKNQRQAEETPEEREQTGPVEFGIWLRRQRRGRDIELREIAEASKISIRYLQALEDGRFEILPAPVFARGFLRQYAKYVGLDSEEVLNYFIVARESVEQDDEPAEPNKPASGRLLRLLAVLALLALIGGAAWWFLGRSVPGEEAGDPAEPTRVSTTTRPPASSPETTPRSGEPESLPANPGADGSVEAADPEAPVAEAPEAEPEVVDPNAPPIRLTLDFSGECWIEARVDGRPAVSEMKVQGESLSLTAEQSVDLKLGDATVVQVELNGRPYTVEEDGGDEAVRRLRIDLETLANLAESS